MHKYNWKGKKFLPENGYLKNVRKITITIIFLYAKKEKIYPAYVSKHNSNCKKHIIFLMIPNGESWHYLAGKSISVVKRSNA